MQNTKVKYKAPLLFILHNRACTRAQKKSGKMNTEITNLTNATVTKETDKLMKHVLTIRHRFVNFCLFLFNDTTSFLCLLFLFINHNDTVSIFGFFYYIFTKRCRFLLLLFLFSLFNFNKGTRKERKREIGMVRAVMSRF